MQRYLFMFAAVLALAVCAWAQPDPNAPADNGQRRPGGRGNFGGMGGQSPVLLEILPDGVFVLHSGVLVKFQTEAFNHSDTLELFGPLAPQPKMPENPTQQDQDAMRAWVDENMPRIAPAALLEKDSMLYIVIGTRYFCVDAKTLKPVVMKVDLAPVGNNNNNNPGGGIFGNGRFNGTAPQLKLEGGVLYAIINRELLAVEPATGKVIQRTALPEELFPAMPGFGPGMRDGGDPGGGRNGGDGRGRRGNRGGDQNNQ